jgi:hydroxymethylpyrimidine pyrophosphatase-like HAD family hydrolase
MRLEAVVADLDGTLVRHDSSVSPATFSALARLGAARIPLVIATARTPSGVRALAGLAGYAEFAVCCCGAIGWSPRPPALAWSQLLDPATVQRGLALAVAAGAGVAGYDGTGWRVADPNGRLSAWRPNGPCDRSSGVAAIAGAPCCTLAIGHGEHQLAEIGRRLAGSATAAISRVGDTTFLDVGPPGVDKGTGVVRALARLGLAAARTVSFGDMPNDLPMFAVTGRSFAIGRSRPELTAAADEALDDVEHDGFAAKIGEFERQGWEIG